MDKSGYALLMIAVIAVVTALLRFLPFLIFNGRRPVPAVIRYLGAVLPYSVMSMLVVYCLKDVSFGNHTDWIPSLLSVGAVIVLHIWKRNTLLSIIGATVCYMVLIRFL